VQPVQQQRRTLGRGERRRGRGGRGQRYLPVADQRDRNERANKQRIDEHAFEVTIPGASHGGEAEQELPGAHAQIGQHEIERECLPALPVRDGAVHAAFDRGEHTHHAEPGHEPQRCPRAGRVEREIAERGECRERSEANEGALRTDPRDERPKAERAANEAEVVAGLHEAHVERGPLDVQHPQRHQRGEQAIAANE
jgi:hypothetical protein